jgi:signal transduction histidine kinase
MGIALKSWREILVPWRSSWTWWSYQGAFREESLHLLQSRLRVALPIAIGTLLISSIIEYQLFPELRVALILPRLMTQLGMLALFIAVPHLRDFDQLRIAALATVLWTMAWIVAAAGAARALATAGEILIGCMLAGAVLIPWGLAIQTAAAAGAILIYGGALAITGSRSSIDFYNLFLICVDGLLSVAAINVLENSRHRIFTHRMLELEFVATLSHDMRAPAASISMRAELMAEDTHDPALRENVESMRACATQILNLAQNMIDSMRIENNELSFKPSPFSLNDLVTETAAEMESVAMVRKVRVSSRLTASLPLLNLDRFQLKRVFTNLLNNALKSTPNAGNVLVTTEDRPPWIRLSVTDDGPAVEARERRLIFDRFNQLTRRSNDGNGLGLFIVKSIVDRMGGRVEIASASVTGATFTVLIPRVVVSGPPPGIPKPRAPTLRAKDQVPLSNQA